MSNKHRPDLFTHTLNSLRTGAAQELSEELTACVDAVRETQKMATLTVVLKIKPEGEGMYGIEEEIKSKLPQLPRGKTILWGTPEGNLISHDPNQGTLELKQVTSSEEQTEQPLRQVNA